MAARLHYIAREGELPLETDQGLTLDGSDEIDAFVDDWAADFSTRKNSRDAVSMVVSLPHGADSTKALDSARNFFAGTFAENHEYAFTGHHDKDHFHVHVVIKMRGHDGKQLVTDKQDLSRWRESFAEHAKEQGIFLDASPRYARGKGRRGVPGVIHQLRTRGDNVRMDRAAAEEALHAEDRRYDEVLLATNRRERLAYAKHAASVSRHAMSMGNPKKRLEALRVAMDLALFAEEMPRPRTRREVLRETLNKARKHRSRPGLQDAKPYLEKVVTQVGIQLRGFDQADRNVQSLNKKLGILSDKQDRGSDLER